MSGPALKEERLALIGKVRETRKEILSDEQTNENNNEEEFQASQGA